MVGLFLRIRDEPELLCRVSLWSHPSMTLGGMVRTLWLASSTSRQKKRFTAAVVLPTTARRRHFIILVILTASSLHLSHDPYFNIYIFSSEKGKDVGNRVMEKRRGTKEGILESKLSNKKYIPRFRLLSITAKYIRTELDSFRILYWGQRTSHNAFYITSRY